MKTILSMSLLLTCQSTFSQTKVTAVIAEMRPMNAGQSESLKTFNDDTLGKWDSNGFFRWKVTGNKDADNQSKLLAAEKFRNDNPALYQTIAFDSLQHLKIPEKDFQSMSQEKKDFILSHPDKFSIAK